MREVQGGRLIDESKMESQLAPQHNPMVRFLEVHLLIEVQLITYTDFVQVAFGTQLFQHLDAVSSYVCLGHCQGL